MPPQDYRYDERYYRADRERDPRDPPEYPADPREMFDPRDPRDPREADPRGMSPGRGGGGYYPPPPHYYREGYPPPRESSYPPRSQSRPTSSSQRPVSSHAHLGKRSPESRPTSDLLDDKRMPSWSPHPQQRYPSVERASLAHPSHVRHSSNGSSHGSQSNLRESPKGLGVRGGGVDDDDERDPRGELREVRPTSAMASRRSRSPGRVKAEPISAGVTLPSIRAALSDKERLSPRPPERDMAWGRVPV